MPRRAASRSPARSRAPAATYPFTPKLEWSFENNVLSGICLFAWVELVVTRRRSIEWWRYWQRVLFITFLASFNSCLAIVEYLDAVYTTDVKG